MYEVKIVKTVVCNLLLENFNLVSKNQFLKLDSKSLYETVKRKDVYFWIELKWISQK